MYKLIAMPVKITVGFFFFKELDTPTIKFTWNNEGIRIAKLALKNKSKEGALIILDIQFSHSVMSDSL